MFKYEFVVNLPCCQRKNFENRLTFGEVRPIYGQEFSVLFFDSRCIASAKCGSKRQAIMNATKKLVILFPLTRSTCKTL